MKKILLNNKKFWIILILIFIFSRLATWSYPFDSDHWIFYYVGKFFALGKDIYKEAWDHKPPIGFSINALMHILFGSSIILHRFFLTILAIIETYIFYKLAILIIKTKNKENDIFLVRASVLFYVLLRNLSQFTSSANNTENFAMLFLVLMYYLYLSDKNKFINLFSSGFCMSIIVLLKPTFVILFLPIFIDLILNNNLQKFFKKFFIYILPIIIHLGFWTIYFLNKKLFNEFWIATVSFNSKYAQAAWAGHVSGRTIFLITIAPFLALYSIIIYPYIKNLKEFIKDKNILFVFITSVVTLFIALINGSFYPYYFLLSIIPLAILFANNFLFDFLKNNKIAYYLFIFCLILNITISYKQFSNSISGNVKQESIENQEIADYIKSNSENNDKIIAYTYGATFYVLSERDSGSRYISASHLLLDEREKFGFNLTDNFIQDIKNNNPKYVIFPKDNNNLYLENAKATTFLLNNFSKEKDFDSYVLLINNNYLIKD